MLIVVRSKPGLSGMGATTADWRRLCNRSRLPANDPNYKNAPGACAKADAMEAADRAAAAGSNPPAPTTTQQQTTPANNAANTALQQQLAQAQAATAAAQAAAAAADQRRVNAANQAALNKGRYLTTLQTLNNTLIQAGQTPVPVAATGQPAPAYTPPPLVPAALATPSAQEIAATPGGAAAIAAGFAPQTAGLQPASFSAGGGGMFAGMSTKTLALAGVGAAVVVGGLVLVMARKRRKGKRR